MIDEWGGIDKKIENLVSALNKAGFQTTGSCEGHINRDAPAPWVKIDAAKKSDRSENWKNKNIKLHKRMGKLLDEFYHARTVLSDVRLVISEANSGFYIHNGGEVYNKWRDEVQKTATQILNKKVVQKKTISNKEKKFRAKKLPTYHKELEVFTEFLNKNN